MTANAQEFAGGGIRYKVISPVAVSVAGRHDKGTMPVDIKVPEAISSGGKTYIVTSIASQAFKNSDIRTIILPSTISAIDAEAFYGCEQLQKIEIPANTVEIMNSSFAGCTSLKEFVVSPDNMLYTTVDGVLFNSDETRLVCFPSGKGGEYEIPDDVTEIEDNAFLNCRNITRLIIPGSVKEIGGALEDVVGGCNSLKAIQVSPENKYYSSASGMLLSKDRSVLLRCPLDKRGDIDIPDGVKEISKGAFVNCSEIISVTIPESVQKISSKTFNGCNKISEMSLYTLVPPEIVADDGQAMIMIPERIPIHIIKQAKKIYKKSPLWNVQKLVANLKKIEEPK